MRDRIWQIGAMGFVLLVAPGLTWAMSGTGSSGGMLVLALLLAEGLGALVGAAAVLVWQGKA